MLARIAAVASLVLIAPLAGAQGADIVTDGVVGHVRREPVLLDVRRRTQVQHGVRGDVVAVVGELAESIIRNPDALTWQPQWGIRDYAIGAKALMHIARRSHANCVGQR